MRMQEMKLLLEVVDELRRLDESMNNLNNVGYHEKYPKLDNVYDIIRAHSIFKDDTENIKFYIIAEAKESLDTRAKMLLGL